MSNQVIQPDTLTDLSSFERASSGGRGMFIIGVVGWVIITAVLAALCALIAVLLNGLIRPHRITGIEFLAFTAIFAVPVGAWLARNNLFNWRLETDAEGITIRGLFHARRVLWSQVTEARTRTSLGKSTNYILKTASGTFTVADPLKTTDSTISLSTFRHLHQLGKLDIYQAPQSVLLQPIPDNVPLEVDWHNPDPPNWSLTVAVLVILGIAILVVLFGRYFRFLKDWSFLSHPGNILIAGVFAWFRERLIVAKNASVRRDGLEMRTGRRLLFLHWTEIGHVHWDQSRKTFTVGRTRWNDVGTIKFRQSDPDSGLIILAIIRQLRAAHHTPPVTIPPVLLLMSMDPRRAPTHLLPNESIKLRPTKLVSLLPLVFRLIAVNMLLFTLRHVLEIYGYAIGGLIIAFLVSIDLVAALYLLSAGTRVYQADSQGVTTASIFRRQTVTWQQVATYTVQSTSSEKNRRTLKAPSGDTLMSFILHEGVEPKTDSFIVFLDSCLASVRQTDAPRMMR